jgi:signal transduction histidine kinase/CHASE3 domain sensor protein
MTLFSTFRYVAALIFILFILAGIAVFKLNAGYKNEQVAIKFERDLRSTGQQLAKGSDYLTDEIRRYVQFGDRAHHDNFWREVNETRSRDKAVGRLKELNVLPSELSYIEKAKNYSDNLIKTEEAAMAAVENKNFDKARQLVFGSHYDEQKKLIMDNIRIFQNVVNARAFERTQELIQRNSRYILFTETLLIISGVLVLFGFYGLGIRRLVQPINKATQMMLRLAKGDLGIEIPANISKDEVGQIYSALRVFKENVIQRQQAVENFDHEQALKELLQIITVSANESRTLDEIAQICLKSVCLTMAWPLGHLYILPEGKKELVSSKIWYVEEREKFEKFISITERTPMPWGVGLPGRVLASHEPAWIKDVTKDKNFPRSKLAGEMGVRAGLAFPVVVEDKTVAVFEFFSNLALEPNRTLLETMKTIGIQIGRVVERELTEKKLEKLVKNRTADLEKSHSSLQDFVNIASHDLKEPLRKIITFGDVLRITNKGKNAKGDDYIDRIQGATIRMQALLDDLLNYSKVTNEINPFEKVDLGKIFQEILIDLESRIDETKGTVNITDIPGFMADPFQMHHLFQNLIGNSLKYHREGVPPVINIYSQPSENNHIKIIIEDNGIGFEKKYSRKIFQPFERLHGKENYSGTGIGLTICQKIIENHNGTIDVNSTPNEGSQFIITFPQTSSIMAELEI